MVVEVNENGEVVLPASLVQAAPHTQLTAEREGDAVVLKRVEAVEPGSPEFWENFPVINAEVVGSLRREDYYDDWGR